MTEGWKCPVCGSGNAPWNAKCDCIDTKKEPSGDIVFRMKKPDTAPIKKWSDCYYFKGEQK